MKLFICATYTDLIEERKSVADAIIRLQHQHHSMEFFGARPDRPIETCLDEVRASDVLVLIIGHLYGTLVPGTSESFTETEYSEGHRLGKPCLVYMRDARVPVLFEHVEQHPTKIAKLKEFKQRLSDRYTVSPFRGPSDLALQLAADIPKLATSPRAITLEERIRLLQSGVLAWNKWRESNMGVEVDLSGANLEGARLHRVNFRKTRLVGTNLNGAELDGADLTGAFLFKATLRRASLQSAALDQSQLISLELSEADFTGATFGGTIIADSDLREAKGLSTCIHGAASTIGIDSLVRSEGRIPKPFLRGIGAPETLISYLESIFGNAIEFFSCFLSYSHEDRAFVDKLHADLQAKGVRAWYSAEDLESGRRLDNQIDQAIRLHDKVVVVISEKSLQSAWLKYEIAHVRKQERLNGRNRLVPISLLPLDKNDHGWEAFDADTGVREHFIADFSNWRDYPSYQNAFKRLLRDLRSDV